MSYGAIFYQTLKSAGLDPIIGRNVFSPPYSSDSGWPLELLDIEFEKNTVLLLALPDFITVKEGKILELENIEQYYKDYSRQVVILHWPHALHRYYQGPLNFLEFNAHSYQILENLNKRKSEWYHLINDTRSSAWQCLNGRYCWHRQHVVDILRSWPNGTLSNHSEIPLEQSPYSNYKFDNEDNFIRLANIYGSHAVNIVTETQYDSAPGIITEKTLMALLAGQVPIVIGYPGIVADCKELGYDMFDDVVDTSYDRLPNNIRARMALELNKDLIQGRVSLEPYRDRLRAQSEFILNEYPRIMETRFQRDCDQLIEHLAKVLS